MENSMVLHGTARIEMVMRALQRARKEPGIRQIHRLRVAIKRLRDMVRVVQRLRPASKRPKRTLRRWKRLFKALGDLREQQVCAQLVRRLRSSPVEHRDAYLAHAAEQVKRMEREALREMTGMAHRDGERIANYLTRSLDGPEEGRTLKELVRLLRSDWAAAHGTIRRNGTDLHALRRQVKEVWYMLRSLKEAGRALPKGIPFEQLGALQRVLGSWHDAVVLVEDLGRWYGGGAAQRSLLAAAAHLMAIRERRALDLMGRV